jgi:hypothetical protein
MMIEQKIAEMTECEMNIDKSMTVLMECLDSYQASLSLALADQRFARRISDHLGSVFDSVIYLIGHNT